MFFSENTQFLLFKCTNYFSLVTYPRNTEFSNLRDHSLFLLIPLDCLGRQLFLSFKYISIFFDRVNILMRQFVPCGELRCTLSLTTELSGVVVNATTRPLYLGNYPIPIVHETGWVPGSFWAGAEKNDPVRNRSQDCQPVMSPTTLSWPADT